MRWMPRYAVAIFLLSFFGRIYCQTNTSQKASTSAYSRSINGTDGSQNTLNKFKGKKIWLVVLPDTLKASDSCLFRRLDSVATANATALQAIVVPSFGKKGGIPDESGLIQKWYKTMQGHKIILSVPMNTDRSKRHAQDQLLDWLSSASQNGHFGNEVTVAGGMYLINEQGNLTGSFSLSTIMDASLMGIIFR